MKQIDSSFLPLVSSHLQASRGGATTLHSTDMVGTGRGPRPPEVRGDRKAAPWGGISTREVCQQAVGVLDKEKPLLTWLFLSLQHPLELFARCGGPAVPLLLAAHLHSRSALIHDRHCVLPDPLPGGTALQLSAQTEGAARRGGRSWHQNCSPAVKLASPQRHINSSHL